VVCRGNTLCIIDVQTGTVLMKYQAKDLKENFYTLAWTTLGLEGGPTNLLASGGVRGEIKLFHPEHKVCFHEWRPVDRGDKKNTAVDQKNTAVNSLVFHTGKPTWLFCGTNDGVVSYPW
jgi:hypothetical protein